MKVFGCLCFSTNTIPHKTKFDSRAIKCCFSGYNQGQKAYKLYDVNEERIIMSRDLKFYETLFPFKTTEPSSQIEKPIPQSMIEEDTLH